MRCKRLIGWGLLMLCVSSCTAGIKPDSNASRSSGPPSGKWREGTYTGTHDAPTPRYIVVDVTVIEGRIVAIYLRRYPPWYKPRDGEQLIRTVVDQQTTDLDEPRNDESDQDRLLHAIEDALNKARKPAPGAP